MSGIHEVCPFFIVCRRARGARPHPEDNTDTNFNFNKNISAHFIGSNINSRSDRENLKHTGVQTTTARRLRDSESSTKKTQMVLDLTVSSEPPQSAVRGRELLSLNS